ncbi:hypothetical protein L484_001011 [Morus notabilis]|uniref:Uncharacterized protein n=1 Tax=Morus notabilis TaxID=981085 RepID=W9RXV1_9ROSA|nr:hypothetical protein L484_001007 [Morus notabilis]EXC16842.1 hypothetical protein L484_001011 [Morus notabilis]
MGRGHHRRLDYSRGPLRVGPFQQRLDAVPGLMLNSVRRVSLDRRLGEISAGQAARMSTPGAIKSETRSTGGKVRDDRCRFDPKLGPAEAHSGAWVFGGC